MEDFRYIVCLMHDVPSPACPWFENQWILMLVEFHPLLICIERERDTSSSSLLSPTEWHDAHFADEGNLISRTLRLLCDKQKFH